MSTAHDHYIHTLLNPEDILIRGKYKRDLTTIGTLWSWLDNLTPLERERLAQETEEENQRRLEDHY